MAEVGSRTDHRQRAGAGGTLSAAPVRLARRTNDAAIPLSRPPGKRMPRGRAQSECAMCSASACWYGPALALAAKSPTVGTHSLPIGLRSHRRRC